jgi:hypothetical protein
MTPRTSSAARQNSHTAPSDGRGDRTNLSHLYGSIGIQAVAAAARYSDVRKKPAHAHAVHRIDQRFVESAG